MASLWDLVEKKEEPQEQQKEAVEEVKEVKEEDKVEEKKKTPSKKTDAKKASTKKEKQVEEKTPKTLEEQIATAPDNLKTKIDVIYRHLMSIPDMDAKMRNPNKTITDMFKYIEKQARKQAVNGCAMIEDPEVFGWAVHYYDEENPE